MTETNMEKNESIHGHLLYKHLLITDSDKPEENNASCCIIQTPQWQSLITDRLETLITYWPHHSTLVLKKKKNPKYYNMENYAYRTIESLSVK